MSNVTASSRSNLLVGRTQYQTHKYSLTAAFKRCFTEEDMQAIASALKEIITNPEEKTADRVKAIQVLLNKLIADEMPEQQEAFDPKAALNALKDFMANGLNHSNTTHEPAKGVDEV